MKAILYTPLIFLLFSCGSDGGFNLDELAKLDESRKSWSQVKETEGAHYSYESKFQSWVGFGHTTTMYIMDGVVYKRSYEEYDENGVTQDSYDENPTNLNTHQKGLKVATLDDLYNECELLLVTQNPKYNDIYFSASGDGLLSNCSYAPRNCADDCGEGVNVSNIEFLD